MYCAVRHKAEHLSLDLWFSACNDPEVREDWAIVVERFNGFLNDKITKKIVNFAVFILCGWWIIELIGKALEIIFFYVDYELLINKIVTLNLH